MIIEYYRSWDLSNTCETRRELGNMILIMFQFTNVTTWNIPSVSLEIITPVFSYSVFFQTVYAVFAFIISNPNEIRLLIVSLDENFHYGLQGHCTVKSINKINPKLLLSSDVLEIFILPLYSIVERDCPLTFSLFFQDFLNQNEITVSSHS